MTPNPVSYLQKYPHLVLSPHDRDEYSSDKHVVLYGETFFDTEADNGIHLVGRFGLGKTSTVNRLLKRNERFRKTGSDYCIYDYSKGLVVTHFDGMINHKIDRVIHLVREHNFLNDLGLKGNVDNVACPRETLAFLRDELDVVPEVLFRVEGDVSETARELERILLAN